MSSQNISDGRNRRSVVRVIAGLVVLLVASLPLAATEDTCSEQAPDPYAGSYIDVANPARTMLIFRRGQKLFVGDPANNFEVLPESSTRLVADAVEWKASFSRDKCGRVVEVRVNDFDGESRFRPLPRREPVSDRPAQPAAVFAGNWSSNNGDSMKIVMRGSDVAVLYRDKYMTSAEEIICTLKAGVLSGDYYGHSGNFRLALSGDDRLTLTIDPFAEFAPIRNQVFSRSSSQREKLQLQEDHAWTESRQLKVRSAVASIENPDCQLTGSTLIPEKSQVVFVVPASRECWTLSIALERKIPPIDRLEYPKIRQIDVTGKILAQFTLQNGIEGEEVQAGPGMPLAIPPQVLAVRFKSLRKEAVTVTIGVD